MFNVVLFLFGSQLPGELVTVVNQLSTTLGTDRLQAKVYIKILEAYGHPPPFKSDACYLFWVSTRGIKQ